MLLATVVFFFAFAVIPSSGENPDRCWMNNRINETDVTGPCPLFANERGLASFCVLMLYPQEDPTHLRCRRCIWRQNEEGICQMTKHWDRRDCCCKTPKCNKKIYKDALPGWHGKDTNNSTNVSNMCISAEFNGSEWKLFSHGSRTYEYEECKPWANYAGQATMERPCMVRFVTSKMKVSLMKLGCADSKEICNDHTGTCKTSGNETICCCDGHLCNEKMYRQHGFDAMIEMRNVEEQQYAKEMEEAAKQLQGKMWFQDETYYERKAVVDGTLIIGTAIYMSIIIIAFVLYRPVDIDKRPRPVNASKEVVESLKSMETLH